MIPSTSAVSAPGRIGSQMSAFADVGVKRGSMETMVVPLRCACAMMRQSGSDVSATLFAQSTISFELRKSTDSCPSKMPPAVLSGSTST